MDIVTLDFRASPASGSRLGKVLGFLGLASMAATCVAFGVLAKDQYDLNEQLSQQRLELRRQQNAGLAAAAVDPDGEIVTRLTRPWQKLFLALESVQDPNVALLEIRPDPNRHLLRLTAEAGNLDEALEYLRKLQKLPELARPHLVSYSITPMAAGATSLRFIIQADWADA